MSVQSKLFITGWCIVIAITVITIAWYYIRKAKTDKAIQKELNKQYRKITKAKHEKEHKGWIECYLIGLGVTL